MVIGIFIRGVKSYKKISFIPISQGDRFSALVGENGIGKSAILESLDYFFNDSPLNLNHEWRRNSGTPPYVIPIFLVKKSELVNYKKKSQDWQRQAEFIVAFSNALWEVKIESFNQSQKTPVAGFIRVRDTLLKSFDKDEYLILAGGKNHNKTFTVGVFDTIFEESSKYYATKSEARQSQVVSPAINNHLALAVGDDNSDDESSSADEWDDESSSADEWDDESDSADEWDDESDSADEWDDESSSSNGDAIVSSEVSRGALAQPKAALIDFLTNYYTFIYVPAEINVEQFSKLEGIALQRLSGRSIEHELKKIFSPSVLKDINAKFSTLVDDLQSRLDGYAYRKDAHRQKRLGFYDLYDRLVDAYFSIRVLNKKVGSGQNVYVAVSKTSSGEKRKALVELCNAFLTSPDRSDDQKSRVILALDEPEISLDVGSVFDQFETLFNLSRSGIQIIITTHWYGFLPALPRGGVSNIVVSQEDSKEREVIFLDLKSYRDSYRLEGERLKQQFNPNISLKSQFDLVQSILASLRRSGADKWVICEGFSDKIYLEYYFERYTESKVKILPMAGAKGVLRIFDYLQAPARDEKQQIHGSILCLIDTDENMLDCHRAEIEGVLHLRRIMASDATKYFLRTSESLVHPPSEIEDLLEVGILGQALKKLDEAAFTELQDCFDSCVNLQKSAGCELDLKKSQQLRLKSIYGTGDKKVELANLFVAEHKEANCPPPAWFIEVCEILKISASKV